MNIGFRAIERIKRDCAARTLLAGLLATQAILCAVAQASAQGYPNRPVVIIVPFAAGGGNDVLARLLAQRMGAALGQLFVIKVE